MKNGDDREFMKPFPRPFLMDALQILNLSDLSDAQIRAIAILNLTYYKNCAQEEIKLIDGIITELKG